MLQQLAQEEEATLYMVLLAAFKLLLFRYTNQTDLIVGSPAANRSQPEFSQLIGLLANTIPFRTQLETKDTFVTLLAKVKATIIEGLDNQIIPFEEVVKAIKPNRQVGVNPIFQVMFAMQAPARPAQRMGKMMVTSLPPQIMQSDFDLTLIARETEDEVEGFIEFSHDRFLPASIARMCRHFTQILHHVAQNPHQKITDVPILSLTESQTILDKWATNPRPTNHYTIPQLITQQAQKTAQAPAVVYQNQILTYAQLDEQSNQLAHHLNQMGVIKGTVVGLCLDRSPQMLVSFLAILKAGGVYVPLDPHYPDNRLNYILQEAELTYLITQSKWLPLFPDMPHVFLLESFEQCRQYPMTPPINNLVPTDLAYIIFTSGSTGKPKGVSISHYGFVNVIQTHAEIFQLSTEDRVLQFFSPNFDGSIYEIVTTLGQGATLYLADSEEIIPGEPLHQFLDENQITNTILPPSALAHLPAGLPHLKKLAVAGEAISLNLMQKWAKDRLFVNAFGPTEATIWATVAQCWATDTQVKLGRPIHNTSVYVLDPHGNIVPVGIVGELYLGGDGIAEEYLNDSAQTAQRFLPNPYADNPNARLYRTGDLVKWLPDGELLFVGRRDHQIKIRGYRVELGEIETVMSQHPIVQTAIALVDEGEQGQRRLVCYVLADKNLVEIGSLREYAANNLPSYMIPATFVILDHLPHTNTGKVNRKALPKSAFSTSQNQYTPPTTDLEKQLCRIWQTILGCEKVGIHDNFFELGGDSILTIRIITQARDANIHFTTNDLLKHQTVAELGQIAKNKQISHIPQDTVSETAGLTPIQTWFFDQQFTNPHHWNMGVVLDSTTPLSEELLVKAFDAILVHHDVLRSKFTTSKKGWQQTILPQYKHAYFHCFKASVNEITAILSAQQGLLNFEEGDIVKVCYFDCGEQSHKLAILVHHLVVDGVSWRILLEDLDRVCRQLMAGMPVTFPQKTVPFTQWSTQLRQQAQKDMLTVSQWQLPDQTLPVDFPNQPNLVADNALFSNTLSLAETATLRTNAHTPYNTTILDLILTALASSVACWTGEEGMLVHLEGHGRNIPLAQQYDITRTVGWFTILYPVWIEMQANSTLSEKIISTKEHLRRVEPHAYAYGVGQYLARQSFSTVQPQISLNYLGQFQTDFGGGLFRRTQIKNGSVSAKNNHRLYLLEVSAGIFDGTFRYQIQYSRQQYNPATIQELGETIGDQLRQILHHCTTQQRQTYTPSDFSKVLLNQTELDDLLKQIN